MAGANSRGFQGCTGNPSRRKVWLCVFRWAATRPTHMVSMQTMRIQKRLATKSSGTISHCIILHPHYGLLCHVVSHLKFPWKTSPPGARNRCHNFFRPTQLWISMISQGCTSRSNFVSIDSPGDLHGHGPGRMRPILNRDVSCMAVSGDLSEWTLVLIGASGMGWLSVFWRQRSFRAAPI